MTPFSTEFLSQFVLAASELPFTSDEIVDLDKKLAAYEQVFLNPDVEKNLISKNELMASFAISKAEHSLLSLQQAQDVYRLLVSDQEYDFIGEKLKTKKALTQNDHDKLEFFNIAKAFRSMSRIPFSMKQLTPESILALHRQLTHGLDVFEKHLPGFDLYKAGGWRDTDTIRVGGYIPVPFIEIKQGIDELIGYLTQNQTVTGVAVFHTALYALHPFANGNKRVCRILEHMLLRGLGVNNKNLYSTSYYYHKQKERYYKYLLYSLERQNLNHFVAFIQEALVLSMIDVVKTSLETKRSEFMKRQNPEGQMQQLFRLFVKRSEIQFKNLSRVTRGKMARQTLVTYLQKAVKQKILLKREAGKTTYYRLNFTAPETATLDIWLDFAKERLTYIPDDMQLI